MFRQLGGKRNSGKVAARGETGCFHAGTKGILSCCPVRFLTSIAETHMRQVDAFATETVAFRRPCRPHRAGAFFLVLSPASGNNSLLSFPWHRFFPKVVHARLTFNTDAARKSD